MPIPIIEDWEAEIECRECGNRFVDLVPHDAVVADQGAIIDWLPAKGSTRDVVCSECSSENVQLVR